MSQSDGLEEFVFNPKVFCLPVSFPNAPTVPSSAQRQFVTNTSAPSSSSSYSTSSMKHQHDSLQQSHHQHHQPMRRHSTPAVGHAAVSLSLNQDLHVPAKKPRRRTFINDQNYDILMEGFNKCSLPPTYVRQRFANQTGLSLRSVSLWFQNQRARARRAAAAGVELPPRHGKSFAIMDQRDPDDGNAIKIVKLGSTENSKVYVRNPSDIPPMVAPSGSRQMANSDRPDLESMKTRIMAFSDSVNKERGNPSSHNSFYASHSDSNRGRVSFSIESLLSDNRCSNSSPPTTRSNVTPPREVHTGYSQTNEMAGLGKMGVEPGAIAAPPHPSQQPATVYEPYKHHYYHSGHPTEMYQHVRYVFQSSGEAEPERRPSHGNDTLSR